MSSLGATGRAFGERHGREGRTIRGLTVEEYINRLRQDLIPLAECSGRVMREALRSLDTLSVTPSSAVERSRRARISVICDPCPPGYALGLVNAG